MVRRVSTREVALYVLWLLKAQWCDHTRFFRRTAKNLVEYATSWSLTSSPVRVRSFGVIWIRICLDHGASKEPTNPL